MIEEKRERLEENKIKSARRKPARRNYNKKENKEKEESKNEGRKERKTVKKIERKTTKKEETKALIVRKETALKEISREKALKKVTEKVGFKKPRLKIIPLGGLHEVGKNITVFQYDNEMIVVDCGLSFPEDDMLGVDLVIPDITYVIKNEEKLKGMVITHGHEDHIGGVPYFLKQVNTPIYGTKLTLGLIKNKLEEHRLVDSTKLNEVNPGETIKLGRHFKVEFIQSSHSIPDSVMLAIHTPVGTIIHTGDFKVDYTPMDGKLMDFARLAELGNKGVLALMSDSTNAERKGFTMSESTVGEVFEKLFTNCTKRIVVATFASNVHRIQL